MSDKQAILYTVEYLAGDYHVVGHRLESPVFNNRREAEEFRDYKRRKNGTVQNPQQASKP